MFPKANVVIFLYYPNTLHHLDNDYSILCGYDDTNCITSVDLPYHLVKHKVAHFQMLVYTCSEENRATQYSCKTTEPHSNHARVRSHTVIMHIFEHCMFNPPAAAFISIFNRVVIVCNYSKWYHDDDYWENPMENNGRQCTVITSGWKDQG